MGSINIINYSTAALEDKRLALNNNAIIQELPQNFSLGSIKIGLRLAMPIAVTISTAPPKLRIGLASSPAALPNNASPSGNAIYIESTHHTIYSTTSVYLFRSTLFTGYHMLDGVVQATTQARTGSEYPAISRTGGTPFVLDIVRVNGLVSFNAKAANHDTSTPHTNGPVTNDNFLHREMIGETTLAAGYTMTTATGLPLADANAQALKYFFISHEPTAYQIELGSLFLLIKE